MGKFDEIKELSPKTDIFKTKANKAQFKKIKNLRKYQIFNKAQIEINSEGAQKQVRW